MLRSPTHPAVTAGFTLMTLAIGGAVPGAELFSIKTGLAGDTVREWGYQSRYCVLFQIDSQHAERVHTLTVFGALEPLAALSAMLHNTPLTYEVIDSHTVAVVMRPVRCHPELAERAPTPPCVS